MKLPRVLAFIVMAAVFAVVVSCSSADDEEPTAVPPASQPPAASTATVAPIAVPTVATQPTAITVPDGPRGILNVIDNVGTETWLLRTATSEQPMWQIGEPLVWWNWDEDGPVADAILESWSFTANSDGSVDWVFNIREGVKFHKGNGEVTAEDVKFTFTEFLREGTVNANARNLTNFFGKDPDNLVVQDNYTLNIHQPEASNIVELFRVMSAEEARTLRPFPKAYFEEVGEDEFAANPIYAGPYEFVSQRRGEKIILRANPDFYRVTPGFEEIHYFKVLDQATKIAQLRTGQVDIASVPGRLVEEVKKNDVQIRVAPYAIEPFVQFGGLFPNRDTYDPSVPWAGEDPLSEIPTKVRQALNYAIDREAIVDKILFGYGEIGIIPFSFIAPGFPWWNSEWTPHPYDPQLARDLLAEAGYPDCFEFKMWLIAGQTYGPDIGEAVASMWEQELGCNIERRLGEYRPTLRGMLLDKATAGWTYLFEGGPIARPQRYACLHGGPDYQVITHTELQFYTDICKQSDVTLDAAKLAQLEMQIGDFEYKYFPAAAIATVHQTFGVGPKVASWEPMPKKATIGLLEFAQPK